MVDAASGLLIALYEFRFQDDVTRGLFFVSAVNKYARRHCQSKFYTACSGTTAAWSSTVFAHELSPRSAEFDAENRLYLFALTVPLWIVAGGAADRRPLYTTEGGWLHIDERALVEDAVAAREQGFTGSKIKIGRPRASEDYRRLAAVRSALGPDYEIMTDANQGFALDEAIRRSGRFADLDLAWIEEPLPADDCDGHVRLCQATTTPIAVGELMYSIRHFREYMARGACSIVQVDVARIGGITPWLKVAHAAEAFDMPVCPHFLMELHVSLGCAVPNGKYVEYIPQLDELTTSRLTIEKGMALAPSAPGIGVEWDLDKVKAKSLAEFTQTIGGPR